MLWCVPVDVAAASTALLLGVYAVMAVIVVCAVAVDLFLDD